MGPEVTGVGSPTLPLEAVLNELGFDAQLPDEHDDRGRWTVSRSLTGAEAKGLPSAAISSLSLLWPGHLRAKIWLEQSDEVDLLGNEVSGSLHRLSDQTLYELKLHLDKESLLLDLGLDAATTRLFVTSTAWERVASTPYANVERELFGGSSCALVIVPGHKIKLSGPALRICSFDQLGTETEFAGVDPQILIGLDLRRAEINANLPFCQLTPLHWEATGVGWSDSAGEMVARMAVHSAALYTADRLTRADTAGVVVAEYWGAGGPVEVVLDGATGIDSDLESARAAVELVRWTFRPEPAGSSRAWSTERLSFARTVLYERLRPAGATGRAAMLGGVFVEAAGELEWHWRTFVTGEIEKHSAAVRDFKDTVSDQAIDFAERTAGLTNGVLDAMKAAVAAVLGSFIGAALSESFNPTVFRIGLVAYSVYLALFAGILGVGSAILRYTASLDGYASQRRRAVGLLGVGAVDDLEGPIIESNKRWFWGAIVGTVCLYLVVLVAAAWAIVEVPAVVDGAETPTVVATVSTTLSETRPQVEWLTGGIDGSAALVAKLEGGGAAESLTVTVTGTRSNVCRVSGPQTGDGFLLRAPSDEDLKFLIVVDRKAESVDLSVVEVRGQTGLDNGPLLGGCAYLGQVGVDWTRPDWAPE